MKYPLSFPRFRPIVGAPTFGLLHPRQPLAQMVKRGVRPVNPASALPALVTHEFDGSTIRTDCGTIKTMVNEFESNVEFPDVRERELERYRSIRESLKAFKGPGAQTWIVYVLRCQGYVKIGRTKKDVTERLRNLQIGNPWTIEVVNSFLTVARDEVEAALHFRFARYQHRNEWYALPVEEEALICSLTEGNYREKLGDLCPVKR